MGSKERAAVIFIEWHNRQHGAGPSWSQVRRALKVSKRIGVKVIQGLKRKGYVTYSEERGSLAATSRGVTMALKRGDDG